MFLSPYTVLSSPVEVPVLGHWECTWNLHPRLLLLFWWELANLTTCFFILLCKWSRETSQLLTHTLAILLKVWKHGSIFSILIENVFLNVNICGWNSLLIFYTSSFFLLQRVTWSIYNLSWLQIAHYFSSRKFSHYQSTVFTTLYSTNTLTNGINNYEWRIQSSAE